jgi:hypothetical protein
MTASLLPSGKLSGSYKGTRRRRERPIVAVCPCGRWRSKPMAPAKAEVAYQEHVAADHGVGMPGINPPLQTSALSRDELIWRLTRPNRFENASRAAGA